MPYKRLTESLTMSCSIYSTRSYCNGYPYSYSGFSGTLYGCDATIENPTSSLLSTSLGQSTVAPWHAVYASIQSNNKPASSSVSSTTNSVSASSTTNSVSASSQPTKQPSTPLGAIIGGAVGGFAIVCVFVCGVVFLWMRYRHKERRSRGGVNGDPTAAPGGDYMQQQPSPMQQQYSPMQQQYSPMQQQTYQPGTGGVDNALFTPSNKQFMPQNQPQYSSSMSPAPQYVPQGGFNPSQMGMQQAGVQINHGNYADSQIPYEMQSGNQQRSSPVYEVDANTHRP